MKRKWLAACRLFLCLFWLTAFGVSYAASETESAAFSEREWDSFFWGQNAMNFDDCFSFHVYRSYENASQMLFSCEYVSRREEARVKSEDKPVSEEELAPLKTFVRGLSFSPKQERKQNPDEIILDETEECLEVSTGSFLDKTKKIFTASATKEQKEALWDILEDLYALTRNRESADW